MKFEYRVRSGPLGAGIKWAASRYVRALSTRRRAYTWLLILSHMRSGSSLLSHLLFNNPEIAGYGETQIVYQSDSDFDLLLAKNAFYLRTLPGTPASTYVLDKILHNHNMSVENLSLLKDKDAKVLFLVRSAKDALNSIVSYLHWQEDIAQPYLSARLGTLTQYARAMPPSVPMFALTYQQLVAETDSTLAALSEFLNLEVPLSPDYETNRLTGRVGIGDIASNIHAGRILTPSEREPNKAVLSHEYRALEREYMACWESLESLCLTAGSDTIEQVDVDSTTCHD